MCVCVCVCACKHCTTIVMYTVITLLHVYINYKSILCDCACHFRPPTLEAWPKPPPPPTLHQPAAPPTTPLSPPSTRPPPSHTVHKAPASSQPPFDPAHHHTVDLLSITAYESTINNSSAIGISSQQQQQQHYQDLMLSHPPPVPHTNPPTSESCIGHTYSGIDTHPPKLSAGNSASGSEEGDGKVGLDVLTEVVEKSRDANSYSAQQKSPSVSCFTAQESHQPATLLSHESSPPLVMEPHSEDILWSSQYSTWSEDETGTSLSADTPISLGGAATGAPSTLLAPPPSVSLPPSLPLHSPNLPISVPTYSSTSQPHTFTHAHPHTLTPSQQQPLSISQFSNSILTPSTASGYSLTPVSFLPDPSPPPTTAGHTAQGGQDNTSGNQTQTSTSELPLGHSEGNVKHHLSEHIIRDTHLEPHQIGSIPVSLPHPNLSLATDDTDAVPTGQQDTPPCPDTSTEMTRSLDTTPTHTTLQIAAEIESDSDPSLSTVTTTPNLPLSHNVPNTTKYFDIVSQLASPLSPSSLQTAHPLTTHSLTTTTTSPPPPLPPSSTSAAVSLQEAFLRRKVDFVKQSQKRLEQIKTNVSERRIQSSLRSDSTRKQGSSVHGHPRQKAKKVFSKTENQTLETPSKLQSSSSTDCSKHPLPGKEKSGGGGDGKENRKRVVTFSSPVMCSSHSSGMFSPPLEHKGMNMCTVLSLLQFITSVHVHVHGFVCIVCLGCLFLSFT